jgi:RimJ/RimL family protein N-acetyltransferase
MWSLIHGHDEALCRWAGTRMPNVGAGGFSADARAIGVATGTAADDTLLAVVVFHGYTERYDICEVSIASSSPRWMQRGVVRAILHYPFVQLGCRKLYGTIEITNVRACKLIQGLGFKREGVLRSHFGEKRHACVYGLMAHEFRARWAQAPAQVTPRRMSEMVA